MNAPDAREALRGRNDRGAHPRPAGSGPACSSWLFLAYLLLAGPLWALTCDVDDDGDIDRNDVALIQGTLPSRLPSTGAHDPRDADGNGRIDIIDVRACALRCTRPRCATTPINTPPTISLSAPAAHQSFIAPATIAISAEAADSTGSITEVAFYQSGTRIGSATTAPYRITWHDVPVGSYVLKASATDRTGATTWSAEVTIRVTAGGAKIYYLHADHLNTPRLVTDETNTVVWRNQPLGEPFGMGLPEEDPDKDGQTFILNLRFPGQYGDRESNLNYNYFRDYDPDTGRYVQSDPIGLRGGVNTYGYVKGNPLRYSDPLGLYTYMCTKPLHGLGPDWGPRLYPTSKWNPLPTYHQFLCFNDGEHEPECGGLDRTGGALWSDGKPSVDTYPKNQPEDGQCKQVDDRKCVDHCVLRNIRNLKRPGYGIGPQRYPGDCQEWADYVLETCKKECRGKD
jgi:RHS repeat-associated protein